MFGRNVADTGLLFGRNPDAVNFPPFETEDLRENLARLLDTAFEQTGVPVGNFRWGVYAFFDYDGEPIYVGQTNERLRTRVRRHLTNQRTDAVAMSVLDPFEVFEVELWPLPAFASTPRRAGTPHHRTSSRSVGVQGDPQREGSASWSIRS